MFPQATWTRPSRHSAGISRPEGTEAVDPGSSAQRAFVRKVASWKPRPAGLSLLGEGARQQSARRDLCRAPPRSLPAVTRASPFGFGQSNSQHRRSVSRLEWTSGSAGNVVPSASVIPTRPEPETERRWAQASPFRWIAPIIRLHVRVRNRVDSQASSGIGSTAGACGPPCKRTGRNTEGLAFACAGGD
jgi:hypothetical protein